MIAVPASRTEITEIVTALGTLAPNLNAAFARPPRQLVNVAPAVWDALIDTHVAGTEAAAFATAFANGQAFFAARDGLRGRRPFMVEWKGPHRPPGDDVIPADLRIDRVYLISCKYLSKVLLNPGPPRLFERLLVGEERSGGNWFLSTAPSEFQAFYEAALAYIEHGELPAHDETVSGFVAPGGPPAHDEGVRQQVRPELPDEVHNLTRVQQTALKTALPHRVLPSPLKPAWADLCRAVSTESARRWNTALSSPMAQRTLLWRMLRIPVATYFVLGADKAAHLRLRVDSTWDWTQAYQLRSFRASAGTAGQPEVRWQAIIAQRNGEPDRIVDGHVEIRWSHGRFLGSPEAKVYLDTPHDRVPGYHPLH